MMKKPALIAAAAALAAAAVTAALLSPAPAPDLPRGAELPDNSRDEVALTRQVHHAITASLSPSRDVSAALVAPAGEDWWRLVTGLAPNLGLDTTPLPKQAMFVALTKARAVASASDQLAGYPALHVGLETDAAAEAFAKSATETVRGSHAFVRGAVVSFVPSYIDHRLEPFAPDPIRITEAVEGRGTWVMDLSADARTTAAHSPYRDDYLAFTAALGIAETGTVWTGTSTTAAGPWTGAVANWDPTTVDLPSAVEALSASAETHCIEDEGGGIAMATCVELDEGLKPLANVSSFTDATGRTWGRGTPHPRNTSGAKTVLSGTIQPDAWDSFVSGSHVNRGRGLAHIGFALASDRTLTVTADLSERTRQTHSRR